jgi:hypothetical protein
MFDPDYGLSGKPKSETPAAPATLLEPGSTGPPLEAHGRGLGMSRGGRRSQL